MDYHNLIKQSKSRTEFSYKLGYAYYNGRIGAIVNQIIKTYQLDISHFTPTGGGYNLKHPFVEKICPVCQKTFTTQSGGNNKKITCGYSCSNKFFAKKRIPDEKLKQYTTICFRHHEKKCIICHEKNIVTVHHFDENNKNNLPDNLIPLCPTHHQYCHSKYKNLIYNQIIEYREKYIKLNKI